jgi:preprotein translocase subunit YajC
MFITPAYAQAPGAPGGDFLSMMLPLVLIFVVFYFLLIRPQQKRMKEHKAKIEAIRRGDRVVTGGGLIGTVAKIMDVNEVLVESADNVRVRVVRGTITDILSKGEPADGDKAEEKPAEKSEGGLLGRFKK